MKGASLRTGSIFTIADWLLVFGPRGPRGRSCRTCIRVVRFAFEPFGLNSFTSFSHKVHYKFQTLSHFIHSLF